MQPAFLPPFAPSSRRATLPVTRSASPRRPRAPGAAGATSLWVERKATVLIEVPPKEAYDYYIDLESMPAWSPWLKSVEVDKVEPDVSRWTLASRGIEISWKARNTEVRRGEIIAWKSESGLPNRGRVMFEAEGDSKSYITLAIEFDVPSAIAKAIDNDFIGRFVEETLLADLQRFRKVALSQRRRTRSKNFASSPDATA